MNLLSLSQKNLPHSSLSSLIIIIIVTLCGINPCATMTLHKNKTVPAVLVFGDSIVDPGNNNDIETLVKCNFPPYGRDFVGRKPTGRCSNGKDPSDFIAERFGLKEFLPAYLSPNLQLQELLTGVSFASSGSGYDPLTAKLLSVLSLSGQLQMFKSYIRKIKAAVGEKKTKIILSNSIFLVCTGSDDIATTYFITPFRKDNYTISAYTDLMVKSATGFLQELHQLGARRIGVMSIPVIGCVPFQRALGGGIQRGCSESVNNAAMLFNSKLSTQMHSLNKRLPHARLVYLDIYNPSLDLVQNPAHYGLKVVDKGCCGTGDLEAGFLCNRYGYTCSNDSEYMFWDSYHPSERAYQILSSLVLDKTINKFF